MALVILKTCDLACSSPWSRASQRLHKHQLVPWAAIQRDRYGHQNEERSKCVKFCEFYVKCEKRYIRYNLTINFKIVILQLRPCRLVPCSLPTDNKRR